MGNKVKCLRSTAYEREKKYGTRICAKRDLAKPGPCGAHRIPNNDEQREKKNQTKVIHIQNMDFGFQMVGIVVSLRTHAVAHSLSPVVYNLVSIIIIIISKNK